MIIMKKYIPSISITLVLISCQVLGLIYREYSTSCLYLGLILITPIVIFSMIKQRKEDKLNGTKNFQTSITGLLIAQVIFGVCYFILMQNYK